MRNYKLHWRNMLLVHYGHRKFNLKKFEPAALTQDTALTGVNTVKPTGGFWTCPLNARRSILRWCRATLQNPPQLRSRVIVRFEGTVYTINRNTTFWDIVYMITERKADAIHLPESQLNHRFFQNWDCDTVFVINPLSIKEQGLKVKKTCR